MAAWTTLCTFDNYVTAHIIKSRLEVEGIICTLRDEHTIVMQWAWANALGGIKLDVPPEQYELAKHILSEIDSEVEADRQTIGFEEDTAQLNPDNRICTHCGSKNTKNLEYSKRASFLSWIMLGFPIPLKTDKWHCFHCGENF